MDNFSALLRERTFVRVWIARLFGTTANQMLLVALGWQMYELTGSALDLGLVGLYQFLPALLLTLPAGHVADRFPRAKIVGLCLAVQGVASLYLVTGTWAVAQTRWGVSPISREALFAVSVLVGCVRAFQMPAQQALTPLLVPAHLFPRATALSAAGIQAAVIGGPALGGLIFVAGAAAVYSTCVILFCVSVTLMLRAKVQQAAHQGEPVTLQTVFAGFTFIWQRKLLLGALSLDLFAMLLGGATALLPMFAKDILHVGPLGLGLLRSSPAVGALLMSVVLARWPLRRHVGRSMLAGVVVYGLAMVAFALSTHFLLSMFMLAVSGVADMVNIVVRQTLVQLDTPDTMRGRVSAVNSIFIGASNQLGEFESGLTADWMGAVLSVAVGGVGSVLIGLLWWKLFPELAQRDHMQKPG